MIVQVTPCYATCYGHSDSDAYFRKEQHKSKPEMALIQTHGRCVARHLLLLGHRFSLWRGHEAQSTPPRPPPFPTGSVCSGRNPSDLKCTAA